MKFWTIAADCIFLILVVLLFFFWESVLSLFGPCPFYELTGLYCPGCGATRMFMCLRQFDIWSAFRFNPLVFLLLTYLLLLLVLYNLFVFFGLTWYRYFVNAKVLWGIAVVTVLFAIVRNFPFVPFVYLVPA